MSWRMKRRTAESVLERSPQTADSEAFWYLSPLSPGCPSESCPTFSPGSVWHPSFTRVTTPPPQLCTATRLLFQPGTARPTILSSPQAQYLPALLISSQTLRWWINNKSTYTCAKTRRRPIYLVYFWLVWRILGHILCTASCCIIWLRCTHHYLWWCWIPHIHTISQYCQCDMCDNCVT